MDARAHVRWASASSASPERLARAGVRRRGTGLPWTALVSHALGRNGSAPQRPDDADALAAWSSWFRTAQLRRRCDCIAAAAMVAGEGQQVHVSVREECLWVRRGSPVLLD